MCKRALQLRRSDGCSLAVVAWVLVVAQFLMLCRLDRLKLK